MGHMKRAMAAVPLLIATLVLGACAANPSRLDVLLDDPMANPTLSFTESSNRLEFGGNSSTVIGSADAAEVTTSFDLTLEEFEVAERELLGQAEAAGYVLEEIGFSERHRGSILYQGFRTTPGGSRTLLRLLFVPGAVQVRLM